MNGGPKFGTEARDKRGGYNDAPGPGNYNTPGYINDGKNGKGISFGVKPKNRLGESMPGPGQYSTDMKGEGPKFSMGGRKESKNINDAPGPGNYDPHIDAAKPRAPGAAMGKGGRA